MSGSATRSGFEPETSEETAGRRDALRRVRVLRGVTWACSGTIVLLGLAGLLGWVLGIDALKAVLPTSASMKANTALGFLLSGVALGLALRGSRSAWWTMRVLAVLVAILGGSALIEYAGRVDLHIDELLFRDAVSPMFPGRMAPITAANFCVAALALLLQRHGRRGVMVSQAGGLVLVAGAYAGMVGYLYGVPVLYGSLGYTSMALHTGFGFLVLGCGIMAARPDSPLARELVVSYTGGWLARRLLPGVILLPMLLGWVCLQPSINFGQPAFGVALLTMTLAVTGTAALWLMALALNRAEREREEIARIREQSAEAVRQSERELRLVTDHLPTLLSYIDTEGRLLRVNRTYERWLGRPAEEIVGRTLRELLGDTYWGRVSEALATARAGKTVTFETLYPTIHGERQSQITYAPEIDAAGHIRGIACMVLDIEESRRAEAALRQSEKLAAVGRMASSIAHEINNPLEAVMNLLYLARQKVASAEQEEYLDTAEQELRRVANITNQTLRFHRQTSKPRAVTCEELFRTVLTLYEGRLRNSGVTLDQRKRAVRPVVCFEGEIRQVLSNLVGNAIDAMGTGGRLLTRSREAVEWSTGRRGVVLTVADTGSGMDDATKARVFEAFYTTKGIGGSGLGLWISAEIIERHKGSIRIRSSKSEGHSGTVFAIFLPFEVEAEAMGESLDHSSVVPAEDLP